MTSDRRRSVDRCCPCAAKGTAPRRSNVQRGWSVWSRIPVVAAHDGSLGLAHRAATLLRGGARSLLVLLLLLLLCVLLKLLEDAAGRGWRESARRRS